MRNKISRYLKAKLYIFIVGFENAGILLQLALFIFPMTSFLVMFREFFNICSVFIIKVDRSVTLFLLIES